MTDLKTYLKLNLTYLSTKHLYLVLVSFIYIIWFTYMAVTKQWSLFKQFWPMSLTMIVGSMVAGATAEGGAAVAFPVFTKLLHIPADQARTFGLMIQSVGMIMAAVIIISQRIKILPSVIHFVSMGGVIGMVLGTYFLNIPSPYPKILFTLITTLFGIALIILRWGLNWTPNNALATWHYGHRFLFFNIGIIGGSFAAITGSGIDTLTFIVLTLAFGINEKISTPTTVIIMGINAVVGFFIHGLFLQDIGPVWNYWLVCVPIVVLGAPLGAFIAARIKRDHLISILLVLIAIEFITTLWLVPLKSTHLFVMGLSLIVCLSCFAIMVWYRVNKL